MRANPSCAHEQLVSWLEAIAVLAGYGQRLGSLPNGQRPDVLLLGPAGVFVGDAKVAETAGDDASSLRLAGYLDQTAQAPGRLVVIATREPLAASRWAACLGYLIPGGRPKVMTLGDAISVAWVGSEALRGRVEDFDVDGFAA